jgi:hypothetical protein
MLYPTRGALQMRRGYYTCKELMKRDYWQRSWIIQEVFQARKITIHCGSDTLSWPHLAKFFRLAEQRVDLSQVCNSTAYRLTRDRTLKNRDLYHLLERYQDSLCSDPRDRVFSLCGMSNDYKRIVDYSKSPEDLFGVLCGFQDESPMALHRVRISQAVQRALELSTWERWAREFSSQEYRRIRDQCSMTCQYAHHNLVAHVSPAFPIDEPTLETWYSRFHGPNMPSLDCLKSALRGLTVQDLQLLNMSDLAMKERNLLRSSHDFQYQELVLERHLVVFARNERDLERRAENARESLFSPGSLSSFQGLRLFTTHNGRLGMSLQNIF